jgi:dolichol-phosphate mannosyltransferase
MENAMTKHLIVIPTYNEKESICSLLNELIVLRNSMLGNCHIQILIVDDNSPDGTADYIKKFAINTSIDNVDILKRDKKSGLGSAYKAAITHALTNIQFDFLITMDGDGSHQVKDLRKLLEVADHSRNVSLVLGSRWIISNWSLFRIRLSKAGTRYAKWALKLKINDLTGGLRVYPRNTLEKIDLDQVTSNGYCYQIEMAFAVDHLNKRDGLKTVEVPIIFIERENGVSKMSGRIVLEAIWQVTKLGAGLRMRPNADKLHYVK